LLTVVAARLTQPSIPPGSVNEDQLRLGRQRHVWFIPFMDRSVGTCAGKTMKSLDNACTPERLYREVLSPRGAL